MRKLGRQQDELGVADRDPARLQRTAFERPSAARAAPFGGGEGGRHQIGTDASPEDVRWRRRRHRQWQQLLKPRKYMDGCRIKNSAIGTKSTSVLRRGRCAVREPALEEARGSRKKANAARAAP